MGVKSPQEGAIPIKHPVDYAVGHQNPTAGPIANHAPVHLRQALKLVDDRHTASAEDIPNLPHRHVDPGHPVVKRYYITWIGH